MRESERLLKSILEELQCLHRDLVMNQCDISEYDKRLLSGLAFRAKKLAAKIKVLAKGLSDLDAST